MKTKETSTRELALEWWKSLTPKRRGELGIRYFNNYHNTGKEIEEIFKNETSHIDPTDIEASYNMQVKPNQKQFKEFNPELFKAYINKFKHEDLRHMFTLIQTKLGKDFGDKISIKIE